MTPDSFFDYLKDRDTISKEIYKKSSHHKDYGRFPRVNLPPAQELNVSISGAIQLRESIREYLDKSVSLQQISNLLFWSAGFSGKKIEGGAKRSYPSGGAKYPIEIYICVMKEGDIQRGVYHYDDLNHRLTRLLPVDTDKLTENIIGKDVFAQKCGIMILFSYRKSRSFGKYGSVAYKLALIESGTICQNMYLISPLVGLGCCALGGVQKGVEELLCCDEDESVIYKMAIGNI
ncbi:MAG: SagB/ThcOx family dehydrogenase [Candidatus Paceibacterota bacterium]|jgi:SagB-type dehydrogenase family enzyme